MRKIAVFVATTGGAVQIQRLTPERAPQSLICLSRSSTILPISGEYDDFVRRGSGVIDREFGPFEYDSFRADVSATVGAGQSWQLAFFLAHAVEASPGSSLAETLDEADHVIWATGQVDYDLNVRPVDHLVEKLAASKALFDQLKELSQPVNLIAPAGENFTTIAGDEYPENITALAAENAFEVCQSLGISLVRNTNEIAVQPPPSGKNGRVVAAWMAGALIVGSTVVVSASNQGAVAEWRNAVLSAIGADPEKVLPARVNTADLGPQKSLSGQSGELKVSVSISKPPPGSTCAQVIFGDQRPRSEALSHDEPGRVPASALSQVCGLTFAFDLGVISKYVAAQLDVTSGRYIQSARRPSALSGAVSINGLQTWSIEIPRRLKEPFSYRLIALSGDKPVDQDMEWLSSQSDWAGAVAKLAEKAVQVVTRDHRVEP